MAHLAQAAELYGDDFLAGFGLPDNAAWDEWQFYQREGLRQRLAGVLGSDCLDNEPAPEDLGGGVPAGTPPGWGSTPCTSRRSALMHLDALACAAGGGDAPVQECVRMLGTPSWGEPPDATTAALDDVIWGWRSHSRRAWRRRSGSTASPEAPPIPAGGPRRSFACAPLQPGPMPRRLELELDQLHRLLDQAWSGQGRGGAGPGSRGAGKPPGGAFAGRR